MHIVLTVNTAWNAINFRQGLISALLEKGWRVTVLAPQDPATAGIREMGCEFYNLAMNPSGVSPLGGYRLLREFRRYFKSLEPDVVLSFTIKNNIFGALAARQVGVTLIPNVTGLGTAFRSDGLLIILAQLLYKHAFNGLPVVFFQNRDDRSIFLDRKLVSSAQARLLPGSGVDLNHFKPTPLPGKTDAPTFLLIARLLRDKGVLEFVEAARKIRSWLPSARFQLLGPADAKNRSAIGSETVTRWEDEGVIEYLGTTADVRPYIAAAHCVVLPSYYREGTPRTLLEAAGMARPIITTDAPGCRDVVENGRTGFLCRPKDADDLTRSIRDFLALSAEGWRDMGLAGRAKMEREYDESIVIDRYLQAIDEVMRAHQE